MEVLSPDEQPLQVEPRPKKPGLKRSYLFLTMIDSDLQYNNTVQRAHYRTELLWLCII